MARLRARKTRSSARPGPRVLRVREANEGWAGYVRRLIDDRYSGNQSALAQDIGVAASTVTRWIDGATPTIAALHDISDALDVPMTELLVAAGALSARDLGGEQVQTPQVSADVAEAIRKDADLIERARQHLLDQYQMLRELSQRSDSNDHSRLENPGQRSLRAVARKRPPRKT